jgi:hypothetical protein
MSQVIYSSHYPGHNTPLAVVVSEYSRLTNTLDDTLGNKLFFAIRKDGVDYPISWVALPVGSGTNGTQDSVEAIIATTFLHRQIDNNANPYFELQAGTMLTMKPENPASPNKTIWVLTTQEDY